MGLEGIVSKRQSAPYRSGRSKKPLKIKNLERLSRDAGAGSRVVTRW
jgi:ATP-dependent DNA ligase